MRIRSGKSVRPSLLAFFLAFLAHTLVGRLLAGLGHDPSFLESSTIWVILYLSTSFFVVPPVESSTARLRTFSERLYSKRALEGVFEPILSDLEVEIADALAKGRPLKANWVRLRGWLAFWSAAMIVAVHSLLKRVIAIWKAV